MSEPTVTAEALNDLRQRYLAGLPWTREELKRAIHTMIGQRLKDVQAAAEPKTKKIKAAAVSLDDMLPGAVPAIAAPETQLERAQAIAKNLGLTADQCEFPLEPEAPKKEEEEPKPVVNPSGSFF